MNGSSKKPKLLLHVCCAPCMSSVEERLREEFDLDIFWYNPNIDTKDEHDKRLSEVRRLSDIVKKKLIIPSLEKSDLDGWEAAVVDYHNEPEGQRRCKECAIYRLNKVARYAKDEHYDLFATTLTVSPHKSPIVINPAGLLASAQYRVPFLEADFKKKDGFLRSVQLSKQYQLYRQDYCGCRFSRRDFLEE
jgi:predicted adenine nucleotide alpha hydrolase (AANH) superfamily ATPase